MVLDVEVLLRDDPSVARREVDPSGVLKSQLGLEGVAVEMHPKLVAGHMVEGAGDLLVVLLDLI